MSRVFTSSAVVMSLIASAALANTPVSAVNPNNGGVIFHPQPSPVAQCAAGFSASPSSINPTLKYNQMYTCTGPAIVCSPGFKPEPVVAGTVPGQGQNTFGQTIYGSPVAIKGGRMVYTCVEPPAPPQ